MSTFERVKELVKILAEIKESNPDYNTSNLEYILNLSISISNAK
jgi:hypothetical protein